VTSGRAVVAGCLGARLDRMPLFAAGRAIFRTAVFSFLDTTCCCHVLIKGLASVAAGNRKHTILLGQVDLHGSQDSCTRCNARILVGAQPHAPIHQHNLADDRSCQKKTDTLEVSTEARFVRLSKINDNKVFFVALGGIQGGNSNSGEQAAVKIVRGFKIVERELVLPVLRAIEGEDKDAGRVLCVFAHAS
jgi:hypothetical protein